MVVGHCISGGLGLMDCRARKMLGLSLVGPDRK